MLRSSAWKLIQRGPGSSQPGLQLPPAQDCSVRDAPNAQLPTCGHSKVSRIPSSNQRTPGPASAQILTCTWWRHKILGGPTASKARDRQEKTAVNDKHRGRGVGKKHSNNRKDQVYSLLKPNSQNKVQWTLTEGPRQNRAGDSRRQTRILVRCLRPPHQPELPTGPGGPRDQAC